MLPSSQRLTALVLCIALGSPMTYAFNQAQGSIFQEKIDQWEKKINEANKSRDKLIQHKFSVDSFENSMIATEEDKDHQVESYFPTNYILRTTFYTEPDRPLRQCPLRPNQVIKSLADNMFNLSQKLEGECNSTLKSRVDALTGDLKSIKLSTEDAPSDAQSQAARDQAREKYLTSGMQASHDHLARGIQVVEGVFANANRCRYDVRSQGLVPVLANSISDLSKMALMIPNPTAYAGAVGGGIIASVLKVLHQFFKPRFEYTFPPDLNEYMSLNCSYYNIKAQMRRLGVTSFRTDSLEAEFKKYEDKLKTVKAKLDSVQKQQKTYNESIAKEEKNYFDQMYQKEKEIHEMVNNFISKLEGTIITKDNYIEFQAQLSEIYPKLKEALDKNYGDMEDISMHSKIRETLQGVSKDGIKSISNRFDLITLALKKLSDTLLALEMRVALDDQLTAKEKDIKFEQLEDLQFAIDNLAKAVKAGIRGRELVNFVKNVDSMRNDYEVLSTSILGVPKNCELWVCRLAKSLEGIDPVLNPNLYDSQLDVNNTHSIQKDLLANARPIKQGLDEIKAGYLNVIPNKAFKDSGLSIKDAKKLLASEFGKIITTLTESKDLYQSKVSALSVVVDTKDYYTEDDGTYAEVNLLESFLKMKRNLFGPNGKGFTEYIIANTHKHMQDLPDELEKFFADLEKNYGYKVGPGYSRVDVNMIYEGTNITFNMDDIANAKCPNANKILEYYGKGKNNLEMGFDWFYTHHDLFHSNGIPRYSKLLGLPTSLPSQERYILTQKQTAIWAKQIIAKRKAKHLQEGVKEGDVVKIDGQLVEIKSVPEYYTKKFLRIPKHNDNYIGAAMLQEYELRSEIDKLQRFHAQAGCPNI